MKEFVGILSFLFILLPFSWSSAELMTPEECSGWLSGFESEISQTTPENVLQADPAYPGLTCERYAFGYVLRRGGEIALAVLTNPSMVDCRDGYVGMKLSLPSDQQILPVETVEISEEDGSLFWTYADRGGRYAAEWIAGEGARVYSLTYLLDPAGEIREIRFRQTEADAGTQREMFETAARLMPRNRHERAEEAKTGEQGRTAGRE